MKYKILIKIAIIGLIGAISFFVWQNLPKINQPIGQINQPNNNSQIGLNINTQIGQTNQSPGILPITQPPATKPEQNNQLPTPSSQPPVEENQEEPSQLLENPAPEIIPETTPTKPQKTQFVNPIGFFSVGVGGSFSYTNSTLRDYLKNTYQDFHNSQYLTKINQLLTEINANTAGGFNGDDLMNAAVKQPNPKYFFAPLRLTGIMDDPNCSGCSLPDVHFPSMNDNFKQAAETQIAKVTSKVKNNQYLIGYFTSNELESDKVSDQLFKEYVDFVLATVRKYDSNTKHLIISDRIGGLNWDPNDPVLKNKIAQFARFDIIAINLYPYVNTSGYNQTQLDRLDQVYQLTKKPILISEAGIAFKAAQVATTPSRWQSRLTDTDQQRGEIYTKMVDQILTKSYIVGLHYYAWSDVDESSLGVGSERVGTGLVKNDLTFYSELAAAMKIANKKLTDLQY